eukprot:gnl/MRDRNA2_/MRDRNA2_84719_c0_seq2.p1 gnl/MRDRNA2_/MRDRNA2_84719_c0~~gnl/MRDRNA2_/MRDRNA2_84719_c0_seq2.p1  ORF type:complete len:667 (+),score=86.39 gnl/MRDRNA2_/MRDRNA2_84719_c0_seq2:102-2102(+)
MTVVHAVLLRASILTVAYSAGAEVPHSQDNLPAPATVVRHKKKAGSGYLSSFVLHADQLKQGQKVSELTCSETCRQRNIVINIFLAFLLLVLVNACGYLCWKRGAESTEQPHEVANSPFANLRPASGVVDVHSLRARLSGDRPAKPASSAIVANEPQWAKKFQPWMLLQIAGSRVGQQVAVLFFLFYEVCSWNEHHHLVLMNCRRDVLGWWVYSCEGTKAFARCFPLFAASMALIVTGRYILQFRIYYHFLLRNVLLDFTNHEIKKDLIMMLVLVCFLCSVMHFVMDLFFPPYVTLDKMTAVVTVYFLPCSVFFLLWREASDVEWHLMPLPKLVEDDPKWATQHIAQSQKYLDTSIKHNFKSANTKLYHEKPDHRFELDELLDEIIMMSYPAESHFEDEPDHGHTKHGIHGLYKGLWPGRILLNPYLKDGESKRFQRAFMTFVAVFIVLQLCLLAALVLSAIQEANDAVPGGIPHDAFYAGGEAFGQLGHAGYCRDEGQHRPPGYFIAKDKLEGQHNSTNVALLHQKVFGHARKLRTRAQSDLDQSRNLCAQHCAGNEHCLGFAMDPDLCNIYLSQEMPTPPGWSTLRSIYRMSTKDLSKDQSSHTKWAIVTTDQSQSVTCYERLKPEAEPENLVGCAVYVVHILIILHIIYMSATKIFKSHFVHI